MDLGNIKYILATDVGSTTSKARFFKKTNGEFRYVLSGEAPTTVEAPFEDVTLGVRNAIREIEELTGHKILDDEGKGIITPSRGDDVGVDLYVTTSSAGGGLQMLCLGVISIMTSESANRAALGAGAIVMETFSEDDGKPQYEKIELMRFLRPDMILFAGGTDGGTVDHVIRIAEFIRAADPKPRLGAAYTLPIIYAGNKNARSQIEKILGERFILKIVDNLRPTLEVEDVTAAREAVHECFMEHVMSHAPGYDKLMTWTPIPILPTPAGEGMMCKIISDYYGENAIGVGLGGATTNVYSIYDDKFVRTVSANLGMSYSICNVMKEASVENILRWIPFKMGEGELRGILRNKMIRPTTIPNTLDDLLIEHAVAREALRMGFTHHKFLARGLQGGNKERLIADRLASPEESDRLRSIEQSTYIEMKHVHWIVGTGGLLSHAPRRIQSALMLIDGFQPEGVTKLVQDSEFMMPHLGVLSTVHAKAAMDIFIKDCLIRLGTCIAPSSKTDINAIGEDVMRVSIKMPNGEKYDNTFKYGEIKAIPLNVGETAEAEIRPSDKFDIGAGFGKNITSKLEGGIAGIIIDTRGRPSYACLPKDDAERRTKLLSWLTALEAYPTEYLDNRS